MPYTGAASDSEGSDSTSETEPSNKRPRLSCSPHKQDKAYLSKNASPFQQVTNHPRRQGTSTVKREKHSKHAPPPSGGTPPPGSKPHKPNTINKYFSHREDIGTERLPSVSIAIQTDVSLQQQQAAMQTQLQHAQDATTQGRSGFYPQSAAALAHARHALVYCKTVQYLTVVWNSIVVLTGKQWQICSKGCRSQNRLHSACSISSMLHSSSCKLPGLMMSSSLQDIESINIAA